jgi:hypothetical protein
VSWKPEVVADSTGNWYSNALRFATEDEAKASASELSMRWLAVREWRATECDDPVTHAIVDGRMVEVVARRVTTRDIGLTLHELLTAHSETLYVTRYDGECDAIGVEGITFVDVSDADNPVIELANGQKFVVRIVAQ